LYRVVQIQKYGRAVVSPIESNKEAVSEHLSLIEMTEVLIKHYGHHEGIFNLSVEFQIGVGNVGPDPSLQGPGAAISVHRIGLAAAPVPPNRSSVDASKVNPKPGNAKKPAAKKKAGKK